MGDLLDQILTWWEALSATAGDGLDVIQGIEPGVRALLAGAGALLEMFIVTGLFVPGDTIVLIAAAAVSSVSEAIVLGVAITVGALLGEAAGYGLGYAIGTSARGARIRRHAGEERISSMRRFLLRRGGPAILASRFIPVFRTVMPFVVGLSGFSFRRFLAWSVPASIAWSAIYVAVYSLAAAPLRDGAGSLLVSGASVLIGLLAFVSASLLQVVTERSLRREEEIV